MIFDDTNWIKNCPSIEEKPMNTITIDVVSNIQIISNIELKKLSSNIRSIENAQNNESKVTGITLKTTLLIYFLIGKPRKT